ncbi:uncharacterized protein LOC122962433 [Acropora millepora]|uniref:uncharacterized protein LOC122962433 n=1 Tax=Acropora millepora TaxID=45264 RepID=UPI001CF1D0A8|nr:uncharacterized protein LOC122962433 [Acropora millepora]
MISPSLADKLGANGPREKFLLSTCSAEKELKYGRRVPSLIVRSIAGEQSMLPILVECDQIPRDKSEIPTPEIAREFSHLKGIADQIPPLDQDANIELLIGRDALELLKVRDFRNGPKGAPWAQKLKLGWTVSGEVCLDRGFPKIPLVQGNNPLEEIVEYRMLVHLFGNVSSPAIATFAMRKTAEDGEEEYGLSAKEFVNNDFYVDDGLTSRPTDEETVELLQNTQAMLATAQLRLHKAVSNSVFVMEALPEEDRGKSIRDLDLQHDSLPTQRSLGVHWDLEGDAFTFKVVLPERPYTRRGVLSVINSVYDPLGLAAPVILRGNCYFGN